MTNKYIEIEMLPTIGVSKITGKSLFLACPMGNECREYMDALKKHFGIVSV